MGYYGYPKYVSVAEKRVKAEKKLKQLKKKNPKISPVCIPERGAMAKTWWGKAWNKNLEGYADYAYRLERGRSYARHGAVLDLQVTAGKVTALVLGSESQPYTITVTIAPMLISKWKALKKAAMGTMDSVQTLMAGRLPEAMADLLTAKGKGLFPSPTEISLHCSCPDSATLCKHVAASLYGVGARLDEDPSLLFLLRRVKVDDLISETVNETKGELLRKAGKKSDRVIDDADGLSDLFGIDLGEAEPPTPKPAAKGRKKSAGAPVSKAKPVKSIKKKPAAQTKPAPNKRADNTAGMNAPMKQLAILMKKKGKGLPVAEMITQSKMDPQKVRNTLYQMKQKGWVETPDRGVYKLV
ncbi:hypothetical protein [Desulfoluna sp.]|uniref:hypothetical protein n=1 Tax=Desulfoluna sp. TaxID=2045199 RepID=UPI0026227F9D|nr:hypothetical protein [Desulfoluna sp.]